MKDDWTINVFYDSKRGSPEVTGEGIDGVLIYGSIAQFLDERNFSLNSPVDDIPEGAYNVEIGYNLNTGKFSFEGGEDDGNLAEKVLLLALKEHERNL